MSTLQELKTKLFAALAEYEYEQSKLDDKTRELADTCASLMVRKVELEDKVKELTDTIAKLKVQEEKQVIHG